MPEKFDGFRGDSKEDLNIDIPVYNKEVEDLKISIPAKVQKLNNEISRMEIEIKGLENEQKMLHSSEELFGENKNRITDFRAEIEDTENKIKKLLAIGRRLRGEDKKSEEIRILNR